MRGPGYNRILASTALALIFGVSISVGDSAFAGPPRMPPKITAVPTAAKPAPSAAASETAAAAVAAPAPAVVATAAPATTESVKPAAPAQVAKPADANKPAAPAEISKPAAPAEAAAPAAAPAPAVAAEPPPPPVDKVTLLDPADRPIAEKIRDLFAAKTGMSADKIFASKKERSAVEAFYESRNLAPLWTDKGVENARAKAVIASIKAADADGLDPKDYKIPDLAGSPEAQAEAELRLTQTLVTFARHLQAGRFPFTRVSSDNIELPQAPPDVADILTKVTEAANAGAALAAFAPPHPAYKKLKAALAEMRGKSGGSAKEIPDGPVLKPAAAKAAPMEDPRVPLLREKLGLTGDASDLKYDAKLVEAVKKFQKSTDIPVTGNLDSRTVKELSGPPRGYQTDIVIANMERWRWYPRDLGKNHVIVNQPEFMLRVYSEGSQLWTTKVVVGKPAKATPLLSETMKYITINPTWNVPPSIIYGEYLPALQQDPTVLERMGLKVVYNRDGTVHVYQPPGELNALGRIRFNFPNRFLVYQHDTNEKHYFNETVRAYSHGCMRVLDPAKYAEVLFNIARPSENWTADKVKRMYGTGEQDIQLPVPIWVHLTYQSAYVDDHGKLQFFRDVYNLDSRTIAAIKSERGMIDPKEERKKEDLTASNSSGKRPPIAQPPRNFFQALFGGGGSFSPQPMPPNRVSRR